MKLNSRSLKVVVFAIICFYIFIGFSCVFAGDVNDTTFNKESDVLDINESYETLYEDTDVLGDFDELNRDIQNLCPGDTYDIDKDYSFGGDDKSFKQFIVIDKNDISINGNGHTIDGQHLSGLFKITSNNVWIYNLTFINFEFPELIITCPTIGDSSEKYIDAGNSFIYHESFSPIEWIGDNGIISGCIFEGNVAINGGALSWRGNNGMIYDCLFRDNNAWGVGGAIYIGGTNNSIVNSIFVNSSSRLSNEAIYFDYKRENITLKNCGYKDSILYIDGKKTNIDVKYIKYSYMSQVADEIVDLVPLTYHVLSDGGLSYLDNGIMYYGEYSGQEFNLHVTKYFGDISFTKNYKFKGLKDVNDIFQDIINGVYENTLTIVKSIDIISSIRLENDYLDAISTTTKCFNSILAYLFNIDDACLMDTNIVIADLVKVNSRMSFGLNINFCGAYTINCNHPLNLNTGGFDIVKINGHGTKIYTQSDDDDENKWAILGENKILSASDLTVEGYNTVIQNFAGECVLDSVTFNNNRMNYWIYKDYGAAIISTGIVDCRNCRFTNNYAKYGGAVFNQGIISLENCYFAGNIAYGEGSNVCNGEGGVAIVNNEVIGYDNSIVTSCDKTVEQSFIVKIIEDFKQSNIVKILENLLGLDDDDIDVISLYPNDVHTEGLKVMSWIYGGDIT